MHTIKSSMVQTITAVIYSNFSEIQYNYMSIMASDRTHCAALMERVTFFFLNVGFKTRVAPYLTINFDFHCL